ncbi:MAG: class I SAM-dependent methyltransferase, partial [Thermomicrobia bacterium]|nr:class I SAM-dependent methyltransferase [Thermomicrobia bacterium]
MSPPVPARLGAAVVAVDFAPAMMERLRQRAAEAGLASIVTDVMDGQALTLPDGAFDAAFSMFGLIFFPDRAAGFRELHRVLRPGGVAAVGVWSALDRVRFVSVLAQAARRALPDLSAAAPPPAVNSLADPATLAREMRAAGFATVAVHT